MHAVAHTLGISIECADTAVSITLELLRLLNMVQEVDGYIVLAGQTQTYYRNNLVWYLKNDQYALCNWDRYGTAADTIHLANILGQAPYFLKAFEERRRQLAKDNKLNAEASREQPCSVVLFKAVLNDKMYLLHQWDQKAERYQLIGGKQRSNETPEETATREALEELSQAHLVPGKSLFIGHPLIEPIEELKISRTYGALTHYKITVFPATLRVDELLTSESDLWISLPEVIAGKTHKNADIAPLGNTIHGLHPEFFDSLTPAMAFKHPLRISEPVLSVVSADRYKDKSHDPHITVGSIKEFIFGLSLHDAVIFWGFLSALILVIFGLGKGYEKRFGEKEAPSSFEKLVEEKANYSLKIPQSQGSHQVVAKPEELPGGKVQSDIASSSSKEAGERKQTKSVVEPAQK